MLEGEVASFRPLSPETSGATSACFFFSFFSFFGGEEEAASPFLVFVLTAEN